MDRKQTQTLLATRASLTSQPYGDTTVDHWHAILTGADYSTARLALIAAAKDSSKVAIADVLARIPRPPQPARPMKCALCDDTGYIDTDPHPGLPCLYRTARGECICHAVSPCRCTIGQTRKTGRPS